MKLRKTLLLFIYGMVIGLTGCGNTVPMLPEGNTVAASGNDFVYHGHNFGPDRTTDYKDGVIAGCQTSNGEYTKDHTRFKTSLDYHSGWEHGRLHCKGT
jgi:hypothetical protein